MPRPRKNFAKIDIVRAVAGVSFTTLAAIGGATGNPMVAGISALPAAGLASYDIIGSQLIKLKSKKEQFLELPPPHWWTYDVKSWQELCTEIENLIPQIFQTMLERMQQEQRVITKDVIRQIFIESLTAQYLPWQPGFEQKRLIGECIATPILQKLDEVLRPMIEQIQQEGTLIDHRKIAVHTEQTARVLEKIHQGMNKAQKPQALSEEEAVSLHKRYCEALYNRWKMLDFKGIMHVDMNHPISIPLIEVFIFPDVLLGIPEYETLERENEEFLYGNHPRHKTRQILPQRETLHSVLAKYPRLVLLGDPGSGKSTLLRYLLLQLVQGSDIFAAAFPEMSRITTTVPLYMPLTAFAEVLVSNAPGRRSLEDFLPIYLQDNYLGVYANFIQGQLRQGNLFVLFDGLDEIPDASLRMNVVRHIEMFSQSYSANRFIVTSRIVGYKEVPLSSEYQPYTIADFTEEQVKTFTQRWCPAYEYWVKGTRGDQYLEEAATKEAERLFHATQCRPAVKRLAVNPLLLTILALIQRQGIELPSHRVELFELCAMTLIDTWIKAKGQSIRFSKNDLIKILRPLAFWMHEHPAVGAIPQEELHEQIVRQLVERSINEYEATKLAEQFLETVRDKTGILVERGKQRYGFLHLTFEEYFAARELEKRKDRNDFIKTHLHHPRWREVILLTVGAIGILQSDEEEVTELVHHVIAKAGSPYELILHRDLLFAGRCLADDIGMRVASESEIIEQLVYLYITSPYERLRTAISGVLNEWSGTKVAEKAAKLVFPLLRQWIASTDQHERFTATSAFDERIVRQIEQFSSQHREFMKRSMRFDLTIILAHLQALNEVELRENLLEVLSDEKVRAKMTILFDQSNNRQLSIVDPLLIALSDPDEDVKMKVLMALGYLGDPQPGVIAALLTTLSDVSPFIRKAAIKALRQIGEKQPRIINALLEALVDDDFVKPEVLLALSQLGQGLPDVINSQLTALVDIDSQNIRQAATDVLGRLNHEKEHVMDVLLTTISNPDAWTTNALARILGEISSNPVPITDMFLSSFSDKAMAREVAINALGYVNAAQPHTVDILLALTSETSTRLAAISALGRLKKDEPHIVNALLSNLSASSWLVRRETVIALERLGKDQPQIIDALLTALSDSDYDVREAAVIALGRFAGEKQHLLKALLATLTNADADVRAAAFITLGQLCLAYPYVAEHISTALSATFEDDFLQEATYEHIQLLYQSFVERALDLLGEVENDQPDTIDVLFTVFFYSGNNFETLIRRSAAQALGKIGRKQPRVVNALLLALASPKWSAMGAAMAALGQLEKAQTPILDALLAMLSHTSSQVRAAAIAALGRCGKGNLLVTDAILQSLFDHDEDVRRSAVNSLRQLGEKQPQVVDALIQALSDQSGRVRQFAAITLRDIGDEQPRVMSALVQAFFGPSWWQRQAAGIALGKLGKGHPQIIDTLLVALSSSDISIRAMAARTLGLISDSQPRIIDALVLALSDYSYLVREEAAKALGILGEKQDRILEALLVSISDNSSGVRAAAAAAFQNLYGEDEQLPILNTLLQSLSDSSWEVRDGAANSLATSSSRRDIIGEKLENLMIEYTPIASRKLLRFRGFCPIFDALQEFAKKV